MADKLAVSKGGPKTTAGRAKSAQNALTHGLTARAVVVAGLEDAGDWAAFRASIVTSLDPSEGIETELAERAAALLWRLRRVERYEAQHLTTAYAEAPKAAAESLRYRSDLPAYTDPAEAASYAADTRRAGDLVRRLPDAKPGERLEDVAAVVYALYLHADAEIDLQELAPTWPGVTAADVTNMDDDIEWCYDVLPQLGDWTAGRVVKIAETIAALDGVTVPELCQRVASALYLEAVKNEIRANASALALTKERTDATMPGSAPAERVARYETHLGRQLSATLRDLAMLRAGQRAA